MDQADPILPVPSAVVPAENLLGRASDLLQEAASRTALEALERAIASALASGDPREIAIQAKNLANASVRAVELMREQMSAMAQLERMTELVDR